MAKRKNRFFAVVSQREQEIQSEFEDDLYMVEYVTRKGVGYRLWFDHDGVSVEVADDLGKRREQELVLKPKQTGSCPGVDISTKLVKE